MKKFLLVLILILIVASCLIPPWQETGCFYKSNIKWVRPCGYAPIWNIDSAGISVDFGRLFIQLGLLIFLGCCVVFSEYIFPQKESSPKPAPSDEIPPKKKRKWITKTLLCLFVLILALLFVLSMVRGKQPVKKSRGINMALLEATERGEQKPYKSRINHAYVDKLMKEQGGIAAKKSSRINVAFLEALENEDDAEAFTSNDTDTLKLDGYGLGVHINRYGQPVTLRPDFGGVYGEQLEIKTDAYGLGVHSDQYGRPVREYPWP